MKDNIKFVGIYFHKNEDLYFEPGSIVDGAWGTHGPVMAYRAEMLDAIRFVQVLRCALSFSKSGISEEELDKIYGSGVLPSKGKGAFTKKSHYLSCRLEDGVLTFSSTKQDGRGGFEYGFDIYTVPENASNIEIYATYQKAMRRSIELDTL